MADSFEKIVPNAVEAFDSLFEEIQPLANRGLKAVRKCAVKRLAENAGLIMIPYAVVGNELCE